VIKLDRLFLRTKGDNRLDIGERDEANIQPLLVEMEVTGMAEIYWQPTAHCSPRINYGFQKQTTEKDVASIKFVISNSWSPRHFFIYQIRVF